MNIFDSIEIPATDFERAIAFYESILNVKIEVGDHGGHAGGLISSAGSAQRAVILCVPDFLQPSKQGINVYFNVKNIDEVVKKAEEQSGSVVVPPTDNGQGGKFAWLIDSEGNRIALVQK